MKQYWFEELRPGGASALAGPTPAFSRIPREVPAVGLKNVLKDPLFNYPRSFCSRLKAKVEGRTRKHLASRQRRIFAWPGPEFAGSGRTPRNRARSPDSFGDMTRAPPRLVQVRYRAR